MNKALLSTVIDKLNKVYREHEEKINALLHEQGVIVVQVSKTRWSVLKINGRHVFQGINFGDGKTTGKFYGVLQAKVLLEKRPWVEVQTFLQNTLTERHQDEVLNPV